MTLADLPDTQRVLACPEVCADLSAAYAVSADLDMGLSVWCGVCRFEQAGEIELSALLEAWPMLKWQEMPKLGQAYERSGFGLWFLRDIAS